jgi:hypothetical protein
MSQQPKDETTELTIAPDLPKGIIPGTGVALAHDDTPVWNIVGNTIRVGNIMLVRLDPEKTSHLDFKTLAARVGVILEELASVSS